MPKFGKRSLEKRAQLHPDLQAIVDVAIKYFDFSLIEGHRGKGAQNAAFISKKSMKQWPYSKHNRKPSAAFDAVPYPLNWKDINRFYYMAGVIMMVAHILEIPLVAGCDWDGDQDFNDQTLHDLVHFQLLNG